MKKVLYVQYTNPAAYPPLRRSSRLLADEGWEVRFFGTEGWGAQALRFPDHKRISVQRMQTRVPGWRQKLNYLRYGTWSLSEIARWDPDWIYVSDPLTAPIGALITLLFDTPVLYHEHDSPLEKSADSWFMRVVMAARRVLGRRATLCVLPNEDRASLFRQQTGRTKPVHCVWNCPAREEIPGRRDREAGSQTKEPLYLHYHGSFGPTRPPLAVARALGRLPSFVRLRLFGYETDGGNHLEKMKRVAMESGVWDRIEIHGPKQHDQLLDWTRRADIGLSFMPMKTDNVNLRHMVGASNKPFEYLACGLPLLVSDLPEWRKTYVEPGYGRACHPNDPEDIVETVQALINDRESLREMGRVGQERIRDEWNYEMEFEPVRDRMTSQVG